MARITRTGLGSIAVLVTALWACILGEHVIVRHANEELARALFEMRQLRTRQHTQPAAAPLVPLRHIHPIVG